VETIRDLEGVSTGEARDVSLKGFARPVRVVSVDWRSAS
jgi:hypothetical protein